MNWTTGRSYYIGYSSIDRFESIVFFYSYLYTWSLGIFCSLILPILFLLAPESLHIKRTSQFLIISLICLSNMLCLYNHLYMFTSGSGELNLSFHPCRLVVYISTFAKPMGLYLTLLFSIERILTKILRLNHYRLLFKRIYFLCLILGIISILAIRLAEVLKYIQRSSSTSASQIINNNNLTDSVLNFRYCYRSVNKEIYAKILSFYVIQYWFEYVILAMIGLIAGFLLVYQYCLPYFQRRSWPNLSVNTKFYFSLSFCIISFEFLLLFFHLIVGDEQNDNTDTQVNYLQMMLLIYNCRCICLPFVICLTSCYPLQQCFIDLLILRPYLDNYDENDRTHAMMEPSETFSSEQ